MAEPSEDFELWVANARAGSTEALGRAFETCRRYLLTVAHGELAPDLQAKGGASDLVQETFLEAQRDFGQFRGTSEADLLAWLRQMLLHNVGTFSRRFRETSKRDVAREVGLSLGASEGGPWNGVADNAPTPSGLAMINEQGAALQRALDRLAADHRRVIVLRYHEDRSFEEIGRLMGRSPDAARKLWTRAMQRLREEWEGM